MPLIYLLAATPLLWLVTLLCLRLFLRTLGGYLEASTSQLRQTILTAAEKLRKQTRAKGSSSPVEEGWEKVEKSGTVSNGNPDDSDWIGIIGFFHPFW